MWRTTCMYGGSRRSISGDTLGNLPLSKSSTLAHLTFSVLVHQSVKKVDKPTRRCASTPCTLELAVGVADSMDKGEERWLYRVGTGSRCRWLRCFRMVCTPWVWSRPRISTRRRG